MDITQERLQSFTTDDGLDLRYLDSALISSATPLDLKKPWLILVCLLLTFLPQSSIPSSISSLHRSYGVDIGVSHPYMRT